MLKVLNGGIETLVEDWPGRLGYLGKGMASSGAFDNVALQFANLLVGNIPGEAGLEIAGGYFEGEFTDDAVISLTGTDMKPTINGQPVPLWESIQVNKGDAIKFGHFGEFGFRTYLAVAGGIDVPVYLKSKSTCIFGGYGGFEGRKLQPGDVIKFYSAGGGGYGDPFLRDPQAAAGDVLNEYVSIERARTDYGVVIDPGSIEVNVEETTRIRAAAKRYDSP